MPSIILQKTAFRYFESWNWNPACCSITSLSVTMCESDEAKLICIWPTIHLIWKFLKMWEIVGINKPVEKHFCYDIFFEKYIILLFLTTRSLAVGNLLLFNFLNCVWLLQYYHYIIHMCLLKTDAQKSFIYLLASKLT